MACRPVMKLGVLMLVILVFSSPQRASAEWLSVSGDLTVATDYVFRGVSQSMSSPVIQGTLDFDHKDGGYASIWASNIDFTQDGDPDDGAKWEVDIEVGYFVSLSDRVAVSVSWANYLFPGLETGLDYDYDEILGSVFVDDQHYLSVGFSEDVFATGESGTFFALGTNTTVKSLSLNLEAGYYDLENAYGHSYHYGEISLGGNHRLFDWRLAYVSTSKNAGRIYHGSSVRDRLVLGFSRSFGQIG